MFKAATMIETKLYGRAKTLIMAKLRGNISDQRRSLIEKAIWVAVPFSGSQFIRLASSIVLAWLLAPELLGAMVLINTLRTGVELLTDIGIGQSIVSHPRGFEPDFYNTAWTLQIIRGLVLFIMTLALTYPVSTLYGDPTLLILLPAVAPIFLITGISSPARYLLHKKMNIKSLSLLDFGLTVFGVLVQLILAWAMPTIWALILGVLIGAAGSSVASYFFMDWRSLRIKWDNTSVQSIVKFGKWIFLSSIVFYLGTSFDRLYFAEAFSIATLGIYGIAKTYSETIGSLFTRISQMLIFPKISSSMHRGEEVGQQVNTIRLMFVAVTSLTLAFAISISDHFIFTFYDSRYWDAGIIMTVLMVGTWFTILAALADAIMLGLGRSASIALANGLKFISVLISLPFALDRYGIVGALLAIVLSEIVRYLTLSIGLLNLKVNIFRRDILFFLIFICLIFTLREATMFLGLTSGISGWLTQLEGLNV